MFEVVAVPPVESEDGETVKFATGAGVLTVTLWLTAFDPPAFVAVKVTLNVPALANVTVGVAVVVEENETPVVGEADHTYVGLPDDVFVVVAVPPVEREVGETLKAATGAGVLTVTLWLTAFDPPALVAVKVILNVPVLANVMVGSAVVAFENDTPPEDGAVQAYVGLGVPLDPFADTVIVPPAVTE